MSTEKKIELKKAMTMWLKKGKKGFYLTGSIENAGGHLFGSIQSKKQNLKAPDIKISITTKDDEGKTHYQDVCSLWVNTAESGIRYASGTFNDKRVVGFFNPTAKPDGKIPYLNIFFAEDKKKDQATPADKESFEDGVTPDTVKDDSVPF